MITKTDLFDYATVCGAQSAHDLLLLGGYSFFDGTASEYDETLSFFDEFADRVTITPAVHLHDEDEWNKYTVSFDGIAVGSELVGYDFIRDNIAAVVEYRRGVSLSKR